MISNFSFYKTNREEVKNYLQSITHMRQNLGIAQHHDAVTGTATGKVSEDYIKRLRESILKLKFLILKILTKENNNQQVVIHDVEKEEDVEYLCLVGNTEQRCLNKFYDIQPNSNNLFEIINPDLEGVYPMNIRINKINVKVYQRENELIADIICGLKSCNLYFFVNFKATKLILIVGNDILVSINFQINTFSNYF